MSTLEATLARLKIEDRIREGNPWSASDIRWQMAMTNRTVLYRPAATQVHEGRPGWPRSTTTAD
jgi:hypothetical protein